MGWHYTKLNGTIQFVEIYVFVGHTVRETQLLLNLVQVPLFAIMCCTIPPAHEHTSHYNQPTTEPFFVPFTAK